MDTSIYLIVFSVKMFLNKRREGSFPYTLVLEDLSVHADGSTATNVTTIRCMGIR